MFGLGAAVLAEMVVTACLGPEDDKETCDDPAEDVKKKEACDDPVELPEEGFATPTDMAEWLVAETANGLTAATRKLTPVVSDVLARIGIEDGALLSRMSGSGSTCFGLFADQASAVAAASRIAAAQPDWWVVPTTLRGTGF